MIFLPLYCFLFCKQSPTQRSQDIFENLNLYIRGTSGFVKFFFGVEHLTGVWKKKGNHGESRYWISEIQKFISWINNYTHSGSIVWKCGFFCLPPKTEKKVEDKKGKTQ